MAREMPGLGNRGQGGFFQLELWGFGAVFGCKKERGVQNAGQLELEADRASFLKDKSWVFLSPSLASCTNK